MDAGQIMAVVEQMGEKMVSQIKSGNYTAEVVMGINSDFDDDEQNTFYQFISGMLAEYVTNNIPKNVLTHIDANYRLMSLVGATKVTFIYAPNSCHKDIKKLAKRAEKAYLTSCDGCGKLCEKISKCGGCRVSQYCGAECAKKAWKNGHKQECKKLEDAKIKQ